MPDLIQNTLPYVTGALFLLALLLFLVSFHLFRRSRTDVFWRRRREAGQRGWRLFILAFSLLIISGFSCAATGALTLIVDNEEPTQPAPQAGGEANLSPTLIETPSMTPIPLRDETATSVTQVVVVVTATPGYTPTETPFPTFTPNVTPLVSTITPDPDAALTITALDDAISDDLTPVNPRTEFDAGATRIYLFVDFSNMEQGILWKRHLYRDGELVDGSAYLWGLETEGSGYFFFGSDGGFSPGNYEIRLFIGEEPNPASVISFTVIDSS